MINQFYVASTACKICIIDYCAWNDVDVEHFFQRIQWIDTNEIIFEILPDVAKNFRAKTAKGWKSRQVNTVYKDIADRLGILNPPKCEEESEEFEAVKSVLIPSAPIEDDIWEDWETLDDIAKVRRVTRYLDQQPYETRWRRLAFHERLDLISKYVPHKIDTLIRVVKKN